MSDDRRADQVLVANVLHDARREVRLPLEAVAETIGFGGSTLEKMEAGTEAMTLRDLLHTRHQRPRYTRTALEGLLALVPEAPRTHLSPGASLAKLVGELGDVGRELEKAEQNDGIIDEQERVRLRRELTDLIEAALRMRAGLGCAA